MNIVTDETKQNKHHHRHLRRKMEIETEVLIETKSDIYLRHTLSHEYSKAFTTIEGGDINEYKEGDWIVQTLRGDTRARGFVVHTEEMHTEVHTEEMLMTRNMHLVFARETIF